MQPAIGAFITLLANIILVAAVLVFAQGFFPYKAVLPDLSTWPGDRAELSTVPAFDRLVFMVVDALRSDFVYSNTSHFSFTQSLIRSGAALPFTGHARPPTITMPRIKSITTGSVPSFLDLVLSFDESDTSATLASQDSWLAQLKAKQTGKLLMFGDDTWLRLFPDFFDESDGTTSFFVSDFTEVDNNVTRNVPETLSRDDWSCVVLHYLGLDHIGHKTGPRGPNMAAKQREMDDMVKTIYQSMSTEPHLQSSLLVLLGDHGMNDAGNHGANSAGEVSTALTFIAPKLQQLLSGSVSQISPLPSNEDFDFYSRIDQADLAATLAALMGFPVPKNNLGIMIPSLVQLFVSEDDYRGLLRENAAQIAKVAQATYPEAFVKQPDARNCGPGVSSGPEELACLWQEARATRAEDQAQMDFLNKAQELLISAASQYDLQKLYTGLGLASLATILLLFKLLPGLWTDTFGGTSIIIVTVLYSLTLFASSYVEEEHQFWYWIGSAWLLLLAITNQRVETVGTLSRIKTVVPILVFGICRRWNQTGQKFAGGPDLAGLILRPNPNFLWVWILLTYLLIAVQLVRELKKLDADFLDGPLLFAVLTAILFKLVFTAADAPELIESVTLLGPLTDLAAKLPLVTLARTVFVGLAALLVMVLYRTQSFQKSQRARSGLPAFHGLLSIFLMTQSRTIDIPLFLAFSVCSMTLDPSRSMGNTEIVLTTLILQYSSFFMTGGTNAISSVDLSNAYNGIGGFNVVAVGILTFVSNWAGPIWWTSAMACVMRPPTVQSERKRSTDYFTIFSAFISVSVTATLLACTLLREHLFIWTVFSPKYLFMMAWTFGQHMIVNSLFCGLIMLSG